MPFLLGRFAHVGWKPTLPEGSGEEVLDHLGSSRARRGRFGVRGCGAKGGRLACAARQGRLALPRGVGSRGVLRAGNGLSRAGHASALQGALRTGCRVVRRGSAAGHPDAEAAWWIRSCFGERFSRFRSFPSPPRLPRPCFCSSEPQGFCSAAGGLGEGQRVPVDFEWQETDARRQRLALEFTDQAMMGRMTWPPTSVRRKRRPL